MDLGPTGEQTRQRVKQLREMRRISYAELSRMLGELGRDIPPLGLRRIEAGERRVDVDDLVALAVAFGVAPTTLLMPDAADRKESVAATGTGERPAESLWKWLIADNPLKGSGRDVVEFWLDSLPAWEREQIAARVATKKRRAIAGRGITKGESN